MRRSRRAVLRAVASAAFLIVSSPPPALAKEVREAEQSVRASAALRLATLAERIAKLHAQTGQGVLAERSRRAMPEALREFERELRTTSARAPTPEIRDNYVLLALLWREYREWALKAPTRENARKLRERNEEVVWVAAKGARLLQERSRAGESASALRAENAAVLSQRIPKLYLWRRWDMRDEALARELREAEENLRRALEAMQAARENTPEISAELQAAASQLAFMAEAARELERAGATTRSIEFIAKTGDHILEAMERAARLYESAP